MSGVKLFVVKVFYRLSFLTVLRLETAMKEHEFIKRNSQLCKKKRFHTTACLLPFVLVPFSFTEFHGLRLNERRYYKL